MVRVTQLELLKLRQSLGMCGTNSINDKSIASKRKGEIEGHSDNFKVLMKDGSAQPSPLEIAGVKKSWGCKMPLESGGCVSEECHEEDTPEKMQRRRETPWRNGRNS